MQTRTFQIIVFCLLIIPIGGCGWVDVPRAPALNPAPPSASDPNPPVQSAALTDGRRLVIDPKGAAQVEAGVEVAAGILPFLGPVGTLAGGLLLGGLGIWRKMKPALAAAQTQAEQYHAATAVTVAGIEDLKKVQPETWKTLEALIDKQLERAGVDPKAVENVIRAIRGLPVKA